jgi:lipopolysaccharide transport system ATP-binding protein
MSDVIIRAENLGKKYTIGHKAENGRYVALRDVLVHNAKNLWNKTKDLVSGKPIIQGETTEEVWALKDLNFEIKRGEAIGIIGRNGAGKSTLLKILSRITEPTTGRVTIKGRVASLLEVGTGFHPELSWRENIYLNGTILGMTRAEIKQKFDEIVSFAEIGKYLDTPVKRYSSGMYVRLAFAVAAHLNPEILIVDEVLAVGDAAFQKKCLGKMEEVGKEGRTVLFVSHNLDAVTRLCGKAILLKNGSIVNIGEAASVIASYVESAIGLTHEKKWNGNKIIGNENVSLLELFVHNINSVSKNTFELSELVEISIKYKILKGDYFLQPAISIANAMGVNVFDSHDTNREWRRRKKQPGIYISTVTIPGNLLAEGVFLVSVAILTPDPFHVHPTFPD